jgi:predicted transcriptional regulator
MKREVPSPAQDRILKLLAASDAARGIRSSEIETGAGMTTGEVRMATKWLVSNGYVSGTKRIVRFDFGRQGVARKPILFWRLTDKGGEHVRRASNPAA